LVTVSPSIESLTTNQALNSKPSSETPLQQETPKQPLDNVSRQSTEKLHVEDSSTLKMERKDHEDTGSADNEAGQQFSKPISKPNLIRKFLDNPLLIACLALGSVVSAGTDFVKIPELLKRVVDKYSVVLIKGTMMARYLETAVEAFNRNRVVESAGRLMGLAALPLVKLNDLTLATGLGEFIPQLDLALEGKVKQRRAQNLSDKPETKYENLKMWFSSLGEAYKEIFSGGLGENRKLFPKGKDEGHTLVMAGTLTFLGASLGMLLGAKSRDLANKVFGSVRSFGGLVADYTLLTHPDSNMRKAGIVTTISSIVDGIQRFLPEKTLNTVNHLNLLNGMFANQLLTGRTHETSEDNVKVYDGSEAAFAFA
jgi:hypothetical protein